MAIALVQSKEGIGSATGNFGITFDNSVTAGSLLIVFVNAYSMTSPYAVTITDTQGNTWYTANSYVSYEGTYDTAYLFYCPNAAAGATTVNLDGSGTSTTYFGALITEWSGMATSSPLDQTTKTKATTSSPTSGNITTTQDEELIVGLLVHDISTQTLTSGSGYTQLDEYEDQAAGMPYHAEYKTVSSTGTYAATFTIGAGISNVAFVASFKGSGAAPPAAPSELMLMGVG